MSVPASSMSAHLQLILAALSELEPLFHRVEPGTDRDAFARMITADFHEVGASGRRYSRDFVLDTLEKRHREPFVDQWSTRDFHVIELALDLYLLTYTLLQTGRVTRRATIWRRSGAAWQAAYHQGTLVEPE